jgi:hypothetical protein
MRIGQNAEQLAFQFAIIIFQFSIFNSRFLQLSHFESCAMITKVRGTQDILPARFTEKS